MAGMIELPSFPHLNQLVERGADGKPAPYRNLYCVPESIAAVLRFYTGKPYTASMLHDAVYGVGYDNGEAAVSFESYCRTRGVALTPFNGSQWALVARIHAEIAAGHPVLITMPSEWATAPANPVHPAGWTHVGVAYGASGRSGTGAIRVMNPWGGFTQDGSDAWWAARLCYGQVWIATRVSASSVPATTASGQKGSTAVTTADGSDKLGTGFLTYAKAHNLIGKCVTGGERWVDIGHTFSTAAFSDGTILGFNQHTGEFSHSLGPWVLADVLNQKDDALTQLAQARTAQASLNAKLTAAQGAATTAQQALASAQAKAAQAQTQAQSEIATLQQQLADAQAQLAKNQQPQSQPTPAPAPAPAPATPALSDADAALLAAAKAFFAAGAPVAPTANPTH